MNSFNGGAVELSSSIFSNELQQRKQTVNNFIEFNKIQ
jgi:hypothetical protein